MTVELHHRPGCPGATGSLPHPDVTDRKDEYRKALGVEVYVVTGTGRYNRVTGEFEAIPRTGVVRCIECAEETLVPPDDVPSIQAMLAAPAAQEDPANG